jgi:predicted MFS family arabinose efflux permease
VFFVAIPIGSALGYVLGGALEHAFGWRSGFFVAGGPGIVLSLLVLLVREPARSAHAEPRPAAADYRRLATIPLYRNAVAGYVAYTFALGGFSAWAPKYLFQTLHMDLHTADFWFGAVLVVAGLLATFVGGWLGDRWPGQDRARANLRVCAVTCAAAVPLSAACLAAGSPLAFFVAIFFAEFALFLSTSPINVALLQSVPLELRASAMAGSIFAIHLLGDMISPPLVGAISDATHSLATGMWLLPVAIAIGALTWWTASAPEKRVAVA